MENLGEGSYSNFRFLFWEEKLLQNIKHKGDMIWHIIKGLSGMLGENSLLGSVFVFHMQIFFKVSVPVLAITRIISPNSSNNSLK